MVSGYVWALGDFLPNIPPIVWSGIFGATIAALISFFGVKAANKSSLERLRLQHDYDRVQAEAQRAHDAKQKEEDRKAAIRREAYMAAVEQAHGFLVYVGGLPDRPLRTEDDSAAFQCFLAANAKVWLVADTKGATLSRELTNLAGELFLAATKAARPIRASMEPVRQLDRDIEFLGGRVQQMEVNLIDASASAGENDANKAQAAVDTSKILREQLLRNQTSRDNLFAATVDSRREYLVKIGQEMDAAQTMLVKLVSALREEIHLPANEELFLEINAAMKARAMNALSKALKPA